MLGRMGADRIQIGRSGWLSCFEIDTQDERIHLENASRQDICTTT